MTDQSTTTSEATENTEATGAQEPDTQSQDTQDTQAPEETQAPQMSEAELIHKFVTENKVIKGDTVRTKQATSYLEMFGEEDPFEHPTLAGLDAEKLVAICQSGAATLPLDERKARAEHYSSLPPSHQWLKGIAATALAIKAMQLGVDSVDGVVEAVTVVTGDEPDTEQVEEIKAEADDTAEGAGEADQAEAEQQQDSSEQDESDES